MLLDATSGDADGLNITLLRHVHWGYWGPQDVPDGSLTDFAAATERLTERICEIAAIRDGDAVLDVGCGFGGTISSLNERYSGLSLTGLNIDSRQIAVAKGRTAAAPGNRVEFVMGDACRMPFADASFNVLLAVECIFHFASRERFFDEARRVLSRRTDGCA
jgi:ubiquinone/menaquinone biosynthesis C-methylase UbiE